MSSDDVWQVRPRPSTVSQEPLWQKKQTKTKQYKKKTMQTNYHVGHLLTSDKVYTDKDTLNLSMPTYFG